MRKTTPEGELFYVYIKGDYAGMTIKPYNRKRVHNNRGNKGNMQLIQAFTDFREARNLEDKLHLQGYRGAMRHSEEAKAKMRKPKSEEHIANMRKAQRKYKYTTPAGTCYSVTEAGEANGVSKSAANKMCRHLTKWPEWSRTLLKN